MTRRAAYEQQDAPAGIVAAVVGGLAGLLLIGLLVVWASFSLMRPNRPPAVAPSRLAPAAAPRLETDPLADRLAVEQGPKQRLESYGWTDKSAGLAHIPIGRAMALQAQSGWPDAEAAP